MRFVLLRRGGRYFRVVEPDWIDPLDGSFARDRGGRWNARGSFAVVYLDRTIAAAAAYVRHKHRGKPWQVEHLDPGPDLVETDVPEGDFVDIVTGAGIGAAGLPEIYPDGADWAMCAPIGQQAFDAGHPGIACRSASWSAPAGAEELAWFQRDGANLPLVARRAFEDWF